MSLNEISYCRIDIDCKQQQKEVIKFLEVFLWSHPYLYCCKSLYGSTFRITQQVREQQRAPPLAVSNVHQHLSKTFVLFAIFIHLLCMDE